MSSKVHFTKKRPQFKKGSAISILKSQKGNAYLKVKSIIKSLAFLD
jgi:hypothetical protein